MNDHRHRIKPDWAASLRAVLDAARLAGSTGVLAFDLDSTVFDNRPRQARIIREFGAQAKLAALTRCAPEHFVSGWDLKAAMVACGLSEDEAEARYKDTKAFWASRFFTSEYCVDDVAIAGAPEFLKACVDTRAQVAYLTGRHEEMRRGTVECLQKCGMPVPGGNVHLIMKPTLREDDDAFKRVAHARVESMGELLAAFDNEPTHANDYATRFPRAVVVHLATDHSGRAVDLIERVISVPDFRATW
ncbi:MAG: hypothetical protein JNK82_11880 [Myxococcaceae bacterium]|nr:hypothetical protein [Myxococcaceae bacterium]